MKGKIWIGDMSEADKELAFKAVQKIDGFYRHKSLPTNGYVAFFIEGSDITHLSCIRGKSYYYDDDKESTEITLQQLLKLAGMEENMTAKQFSKKDLVAGKHVVELAEGSRYTLVNLLDKIVGFNLQAEHKGFHDTWYDSLYEDMTYPYNKNHAVVAVYEMVKLDVYWSCSDSSLKLVWERTPPKTATQIELEKLQQQIAELQAQANKLKDTL